MEGRQHGGGKGKCGSKGGQISLVPPSVRSVPECQRHFGNGTLRWDLEEEGGHSRYGKGGSQDERPSSRKRLGGLQMGV